MQSDEAGRDDWTFAGTWPHPPSWHPTPGGRMHYVDVGPRDAPPLVMVHGNPTWGYLWRRFVEHFAHGGFRCIVPDHLGFGRSDKPFPSHHYSVEKHASRFASLMDRLDLTNVTLVVQDWGGPIASDWVSHNLDRVGQLVVLNTLMQPIRKPLALHGFLKMIRTPLLGEWLVLGRNATVEEFLLKRANLYPERFDEAARAAYRQPFKSWWQRKGMLCFPRSIAATAVDPTSVWMEPRWAKIRRMEASSLCVIWPMHDKGFVPDMLDEYWLKDFPGCEVHQVRSGHYIQEDAYEESISIIDSFLRRRVLCAGSR